MIPQDQVIRAFLDKLAEYGVKLSDPSRIKLDGQWHRAHVEGDRRSALNLSYKIFYDDRPAGFFEDHKRGFSDTFSVANGEDLDPAAREAARREWARRQAEREAEQERAYAEAAERAQRALNAAGADQATVAAHPYLARKGLAPTPGLRVDADGLLLIPVFTDFGKLSSLQTIAADGEKLFMSGGRMAGAFHPINGTDKRRVLVCEGYATGAALNAATRHSVACAMSAGNLPAIVRKMQAKFPDREVVAMVDNDWSTAQRTGRNPGVEAGKASGARVLAPQFPPDADPSHTDWDDWLRHYGTAEELLDLLDPPPPRVAPERARVEVEVIEPPARVATLALEGDHLPARRIMAELEKAADPEEDGLPEMYSEDNVALRFSQIHADDLRYVAAWGRWMRWSGQRWVQDESLLAYDLARKVCRAVATYVKTDDSLTVKQQQSVATKYGQAVTVAAIERLAKADRRHAASTAQWDADPWALNTPAGVVDLRTGALRAPRREDHMTKITSVAPGGACPTWLRFLETTTEGDHELIGFLKRMAGYCLTGSTRDHALFFVYGTGGNGKGTFLNTLQWILGDYAKTASMDVFTESKGDRHPTELASLRGARLVAAQETEEGKRWAEARIKAMTGGDPITARFMRQDEFTFIPQFKLVIAGNHKPGLRNVDEAIKRRLHLIPFTVTIRPEDRDVRLSEKLQAEASGILTWAIEGCMEWQQIGLRPPERVVAATEEYLEQQDTLGAWIAECCEVEPSHQAKSSALYASYKAWCERAGEYVLPQKRWVSAMETRGMRSVKSGGVMIYRGIRLPLSDHGYHDPYS